MWLIYAYNLSDKSNPINLLTILSNVKFNTRTKIIKWLHFKGNEWNGMNKKIQSTNQTNNIPFLYYNKTK